MRFFELPSGTVQRHRAWSDKTFGTKEERGPVGPLKHMLKEVQEAIDKPWDASEWADIMFLFLDGLHRAGFDCGDLSVAMMQKMPILEARDYSRVPNGEPSEHDRTKAID